MPNSSSSGRPSQRGAATRRRIAAAAVELVAERGWEAATTRAVAERAGVNPGLVHYHFTSIDELLRVAVIDAIESTLMEAAGPLEDPSFVRAIGGTLEAIEAFDPSSPAAVLLVEALVRAARDPGLAEPIIEGLRGFRQLIEARLARAVADGEAPADLAGGPFATVLAALLDGLLLHRVVDPATDVAGTRDVLVRLIRVPTPSGTGDPT
jgi:AcrR family transcriptional regulator